MARAVIESEGDVLKLRGVVDFDSVPDLLKAAASLPRSEFRAVNTAAVEKIDSAGVAYLLWLKKHYGLKDAPLSILSAPRQLERLLSVTGFGKLLERGAESERAESQSSQS
jgi:ABC-type transporter Mla MlaB component